MGVEIAAQCRTTRGNSLNGLPSRFVASQFDPGLAQREPIAREAQFPAAKTDRNIQQFGQGDHETGPAGASWELTPGAPELPWRSGISPLTPASGRTPLSSSVIVISSTSACSRAATGSPIRMQGNGSYPSPRQDRMQSVTGSTRRGERPASAGQRRSKGLNSDWVLQTQSSRIIADLSEWFPRRNRLGRKTCARPSPGPFDRHRYGRCIEDRRQNGCLPRVPSGRARRATLRSLPRVPLQTGPERRFAAARETIGSMPSSSRYEATSSISAARRGP